MLHMLPLSNEGLLMGLQWWHIRASGRAAVHAPTALASAGAPAPAVVNSEDIELGDGMDEDENDAEEPTGEVQLQQKAVPVRPSASIHWLTHV